MTVRDVMLKYHAKVPFPWSPRKLKKAGFDPMKICRELGQELGECEDKDTPGAIAVLDSLKDLEMMP